MTNVCEICGKEFAVTNRNRRKKVCSIACRTQKHRMATIRSDIKIALKELGLEAHGNQIASHYAHAKERHPYFCDQLQPNPSDKKRLNEIIGATLTVIRKQIQQSITDGDLEFDELLNCEVWEMQEALANSDKAQAVEELYDCIAICLRTIDVLEGRQKLGKHGSKKN